MEKIRAILFDCNGIIADDEPIHLELFQKVLKEEGIKLTKEMYFKKYLAMDDRSCFKDALKSNGKPYDPEIVQNLILRKAKYYKKRIEKGLKIFSGVRSFVKAHQKKYSMAIVSGALRHEIELILKRAGIRKAFSVIISAEDVQNGKPDPECYLLALKKLNDINPEECIAIEDSIHGVHAAHKAGVACIAVTNSYSREKLSHADWVVPSLVGIKVSEL